MKRFGEWVANAKLAFADGKEVNPHDQSAAMWAAAHPAQFEEAGECLSQLGTEFREVGFWECHRQVVGEFGRWVKENVLYQLGNALSQLATVEVTRGERSAAMWAAQWA